MPSYQAHQHRTLSRRLPVFAGALALAVLTAGCATKRDVRDLRDELSERAARQDSVMLTILELLREVDDSTSVNAQALLDARADVMREILDLQDQVIQVQELAGQNQMTLQQLRRNVEADRSRIPAVSPSGDGDAAYQAAVDAYDRGSPAAKQALQSFIARYANHDNVLDAHFFLGDVLAAEGDVDAAILSFERIGQRAPLHPRVPESLYRIGVLELDRGNVDAARDYFERVVNTYGDSEAAVLAQKRLEEIG